MTDIHVGVGLLRACRGSGRPRNCTSELRFRPSGGPGYIAGTYPGGITTLNGVPVSATVRVVYRGSSKRYTDGYLVAEVQSAPDGTYRIDNLNPDLRYDVIGRLSGKDDVISSNITPMVD
jgi:hypothetical protein